MNRLALLLIGLMLAGCATPPDRDGQRVAWTSAGQGSPTVVLQAGFGNGQDSWQPIHSDLARTYRVFAYDRPGTGNSPATPAARDPCTIATELRSLLRQSGLAPPYLLVGHSLGGLYQYAFARLYPDEVAGLLLIDPTHPDHLAALRAEMPATLAVIETLIKLNDSRRREFEQQTACLDRFANAPPLTMPARVLIAGRPDPEATPGYEKRRLALARDWPRLSGIAQVDMVWQSGHAIHQETPETVLAAVRTLSRTDTGLASTENASPPTLAHTISLKDRSALHIEPGQTRRATIEQVWGPADEQHSEGQGAILVYREPALSVHWAVGFIPIIGDVLEAAEQLDKLRTRQEVILRLDAQGVVEAVWVRVLK